MKRPTITPRSEAWHRKYARPGERIAEVTYPGGKGAGFLLSLHPAFLDDGPTLDVYNVSERVAIRCPEANYRPARSGGPDGPHLDTVIAVQAQLEDVPHDGTRDGWRRAALAVLHRAIFDVLEPDPVEPPRDDGRKRISDLTREECVALLTEVSIQTRDDDPIEDLRDAVEANVTDGTIEPDRLPERKG